MDKFSHFCAVQTVTLRISKTILRQILCGFHCSPFHWLNSGSYSFINKSRKRSMSLFQIIYMYRNKNKKKLPLCAQLWNKWLHLYLKINIAVKLYDDSGVIIINIHKKYESTLTVKNIYLNLVTPLYADIGCILR